MNPKGQIHARSSAAASALKTPGVFWPVDMSILPVPFLASGLPDHTVPGWYLGVVGRDMEKAPREG